MKGKKMREFVLVHEQAKQNALNFIESLPIRKTLQGEYPWRITVTEKEPNRTLEQNKKLHKILAILGEETGYSTEEMKIYLQRQLGYIKTVEVEGELFEVREPTHKMSVKRLSKLIEEIQAWAGQQGYYL